MAAKYTVKKGKGPTAWAILTGGVVKGTFATREKAIARANELNKAVRASAKVYGKYHRKLRRKAKVL